MLASASSSSGPESSQDHNTPIYNVKMTTSPTVQITSSTPPRGRVSSRYPAILARGEPGRVPLHRRGTSRTYERLEDLLREAGYKETRVFTPESERAEARAEERRRNEQDSQRTSSVRMGVGAMVDFFAGWIPSVAKSEDSPSDINSPPEDVLVRQRSLPPSPLAHDTLDRSQTTQSYSSLDSPSPKVRPHQLPGTSQNVLPHYNPHLRPQSSVSGSLRTYAQVSAAKGYLRHMASAPNIPKRTNSTRGSSADRRTVILNDDDDPPPMPAKWLDSVAKAVLGSSSSGAHIGGPSISRPSSRQSTRTNPSMRESAALSDRTNRRRPGTDRTASGPIPPHSLTSCMQRGQTAPNAVTTVRVVCRSAPASRSSSRIGQRQSYPSGSKDQSRGQGRKSKGATSNVVPSLVNIRLENDAWGMHWVDGRRISMTGSDQMDDEDDSDEDEGELDLARLLVPPKRQHSIRSLRQHLHRCESARALRGKGLRALDPWALGDDDDIDGQAKGLRDRSRRGSAEESFTRGWETTGMPGFDNVGVRRRRGNLPGTWSNLGGRS